jgi:hypothetical protein
MFLQEDNSVDDLVQQKMRFYNAPESSSSGDEYMERAPP